MYRIIGSDGREYGPVTADQIRQWIAESRANGQTRVRTEDSETWRTLAEVPEFAPLLNLPPPPLASDLGGSATGSPDAYIAEVLAREPQLDVGACFNRAWDLYKTRFTAFFVVVLVFMGIQFGIAMLGQIPILGILVGLASFVIAGPLQGGLFYTLIQGVRGREARPEDVFIGLRTCFAPLLLAQLVMTGFTIAALIPAIGVGVAGVLPWVSKRGTPDPGQIAMLVVAGLLFIIAVTIVKLLWMYSLPLIIDRKLGFWPAMNLSRKVNGRVFWKLFVLSVLSGLINIGGLLLCCVGLLFSVPLSLLLITCAYEQLYGSTSRDAVTTP